MKALLALTLALLPHAAGAVDCANLDHAGRSYTICEVDAVTEDLRLFLYDADETPYRNFRNLDTVLGKGGNGLAFAMNAGMYHSDRAPVGHYVEEGHEYRRIIPNAGPGNFGLLPNGVFCVDGTGAHVFETLSFRDSGRSCRFATQSGPMLVIDGELHPRFLKDSSSRFIRNGVGTAGDGRRVVFAISNTPVTFHEFGSLFRDRLGLDQALYFDGNVSRLYAPGLDRHDGGFGMGPIVGVVERRDGTN